MNKAGTTKAKVFSTVVMIAAMILSIPAFGDDRARPGAPAAVIICHAPGTPAQKTLTLPDIRYMAAGDTIGPCLNEFLPFLQKSNVIRIDTPSVLAAIKAGIEVDLPCVAPGGRLAMISSHLTARDLTAPGSGLPFLNTYEIPIEEVEARGRAGVFSITEEDFRSWVTDPSLGMCFAEPIGPLLRVNNVPESQVEEILAAGNVVVYNVTDTLPGPPDRDTVDFPPAPIPGTPIPRGGRFPRKAEGNSPSRMQVYKVAYPLPNLRHPGGILPGARLLEVKHRTADEGDTADLGVLFMGYVADIDFQMTVGTAYSVTGNARDTKVRELLGWWNHMFYDTLHWYEPAAARGGNNRFNIIPVIGSIDLCGVVASNDYASNCPHTVQHVNVGVSMRDGPGNGRGNLGNSPPNPNGLACGHTGSIVNNRRLICTNDTNHAGIFYGSGQTDAMMFSVLGEEVGHVFGCEPRGAPGEGMGMATNPANHTDATVTFDGVTGPSFMTGYWAPNFRPIYTDACAQAIANIVNSNIPPPTTD